MEPPLISVIMPTKGRPLWLEQAIAYFRRQDYPRKELIIVDEHEGPGTLTAIPREIVEGVFVLLLVGPTKDLTIGKKRNIACSLAHGEILCIQDDDDFYGPHRLSRQVEPILADRADVTALQMNLCLDADEGALWECAPEVHAALFAHNVRSGTLMFRASYFHEGLCYQDQQRGEDVQMLSDLLAAGARLEAVEAGAEYICVRHGENTTAALEMRDAPGWRQVPMERYLSAEERTFYAQFARIPRCWRDTARWALERDEKRRDAKLSQEQ